MYMKRLAVTLGIAIPLLLAFAYGVVYSLNQSAEQLPIATVEPPKSKYEVGPPDAQEILELVNAERAKVGVAPLVIDANVKRSAQLKADDMAANNYFSHTMPSTGKVLNEEMNALLVASCVRSSENINLQHAGTSRDTMRSWMGSEPHRKALLDAKYSTTGIAVVHDDIVRASEQDPSLAFEKFDAPNAYIAVQHFCVAK